MAESPELTAKELAALIECEQHASVRQGLIEKFIRAYDVEHGIKRPTWGWPDRHDPTKSANLKDSTFRRQIPHDLFR